MKKKRDCTTGKTTYRFKKIEVRVPKHACDVAIVFPGGEQMVLQLRPENADVGYNGSLDIILPTNQWVTAWEGEDMQVARAGQRSHIRFAQQLVTELPGDYARRPSAWEPN